MSVFVAVTEKQAAICRFMGFKEIFVCPECGPLVSADEDGCCATCGAACEILPWAVGVLGRGM